MWEPPPPSVVAPCRADGTQFDVLLTSASGDVLEDDMTVVVRRADGERLTLPLAPALYIPREALLNVTNLCKHVTGLEVGPERVLLLLSRNERPSWDHLAAVLIDLKSMKTLSVQEDIGALKGADSSLVLRKVSNHSFDIRLIRETLPNSGCDCAEAAIEDWMRLTVRGDTLRYDWAR